jgi:hypothetical protein
MPASLSADAAGSSCGGITEGYRFLDKFDSAWILEGDGLGSNSVFAA